MPTEEIILLFTELYHKPAIDQLIDKFNIEVNNIPYLKNKLVIYSPMIQSLKLEQGRKRNVSHHHFNHRSKNSKWRSHKNLVIIKRNYNEK